MRGWTQDSEFGAAAASGCPIPLVPPHLISAAAACGAAQGELRVAKGPGTVQGPWQGSERPWHQPRSGVSASVSCPACREFWEIL